MSNSENFYELVGSVTFNITRANSRDSRDPEFPLRIPGILFYFREIPSEIYGNLIESLILKQS